MLRLKSLALCVALGFAVVGTATLHAQDRPDDQHDQKSAPDQKAQPAEHADSDTIARYKKAHPTAAARCHDGFFTKTADRNLACSKHGGIDVWLR